MVSLPRGILTISRTKSRLSNRPWSKFEFGSITIQIQGVRPMKRLLLVTFTALILVGVHAMPAQAAKGDTPDIPPDTSKSCKITQHPYAIVAMDPHANDYLVGRFGDIRSNSDFDMNSCLLCSPYTKKVCDDCAKTESYLSCDQNNQNCQTQTVRIEWKCNCYDVRLCHYVPMYCAD